MRYELVCVIPFKKFKKGDRITDPAEVQKHLNTRHTHFVKVAVADAPQVTTTAN
jgi:hypothetical protein